MRALLAAGALIALAAQPAAAAWSTSAPGPASAKAGALTAPYGITCTSKVLSWSGPSAATGYDVAFATTDNPNYNWGSWTRVAGSPWNTGRSNVYVKIRAVAGSWLSNESVITSKIC